MKIKVLGAKCYLCQKIYEIIIIRYKNHITIFVSATKNPSVAAAIAVMALNSKVAVVPALIPVIRAPTVIGYLRLHQILR